MLNVHIYIYKNTFHKVLNVLISLYNNKISVIMFKWRQKNVSTEKKKFDPPLF